MIKTAFIHDMSMYQEDAEEQADLEHELKDWYKITNIEIVLNAISPIDLDELSSTPDLIIIDYGGMSVYGGYDTAASNIRYVCQYAMDHPGVLLIIWTRYTQNVYEDEMVEQFSSCDNILVRYTGSADSNWVEKFKIWFGLRE